MTWGEFGSTLLIILSDLSQGQTTWSHWEQTPAGVLAVFHYEVPKAASHYEIDTPVEHVEATAGSDRWAYAGGMAATTTATMVRNKPGYEGSLWIDPATGAILRVTLVADLKGDSVMDRGAILVEYGPIRIADQTLICPVRSLALSSAPATVDATLKGKATEWLNENLFTSYHMFASTSRILDEQATASALSMPPISATAHHDPAMPVPDQGPHRVTAPTEPVPQPDAAPAVDVAPNAPAAAPADKVGESGPNAQPNSTGLLSEMRPVAPTSPLDAPFAATNGASQLHPLPETVTPSFKEEATANSPAIALNVNRILVPVVVHDKQGHAIGDLKKDDFQVFDDGKSRPISAFLVERRPSDGSPHAMAAKQPSTETNPAAQSSILPERVTVFLFDDLHLSYEDMAYVQKAASNALDGTLGGSDVAAVVSVSGRINSGLTRDHAKLRDAILNLRPQSIYRTGKDDCPKIDYYQADLIESKHDPVALKDVVSQIINVCSPNTPEYMAQGLAHSAAMRTLNMGRQDVLDTYAAIEEIVRRMATLPGQRSLLLVSSGFLPIEQEARFAESQVIDLAGESNVIINAIDARGLYTASMNADDDTRGRSPAQVADYRRNSMTAAEAAMRELADGTGGTFFHNSNDLEAGFMAITAVPEVGYLLELPLDGVKANGAYHRLEVRVDRTGMDVQARRGYFMPKPVKHKK